MDTNTGFEDIENGPRKVENNERNWLKKVKNKFKAGESPEIVSEEDEKKRKDGKGKEEEIIQGKNRKMIKKANNNNNKKINGDRIEEMDNEEENGRWIDSKGKKGNTYEKRENKDNNNISTQGLQEKKKYVAGKMRIVEGAEGPTPKMIEVGKNRVEKVRATKGGR